MKLFAALTLGIGLLQAESLLVLSKGDLTLAIVDPATLKVVAKMPSGPDPQFMTCVPNTSTLSLAPLCCSGTGRDAKSNLSRT